MEISEEKRDAIIRLMVLRNLRGEYLMSRDDYLFRFNFALPSSIPNKARVGVEEIDGVYYSHDARKSIERMIDYQPFKGEFEFLSQRYMMPEEYFEFIKKGTPISVYSYYVDFKGANIIDEKTHMLNDRPYVKELVVETKERERLRIILRRYSERPAWRGLKWREEDVKGIGNDELYYAVGIYLKSKEVFKEAVIDMGNKKVRGKFTAYMFRYFNRNPVLDEDFNGFLVEYRRGKELLKRELLDIRDARAVASYIREVGERIDGGDVEDIKKQLLHVDISPIKLEEEKGAKKKKQITRKTGGVEIG